LDTYNLPKLNYKHIENQNKQITSNEIKHIFKKSPSSWAPVAHACNPSYARGRDQEDRGLKPAEEHSLQDPISKELTTKKGW
jgi:hypothetical protein